MSQNPFIYVRGLRAAAHTVFAVQEGQKAYRDPQFGILQAYASGQQVKRNILEALLISLDEQIAPVTFNWQTKTEKGKGGAADTVKFEQKEAWSPCDPSYPDQLLGGYMRAEAGQDPVKRRSPLSISAMRPLHPLLGGLERGVENLTFDRSDKPARHVVRVRDETGEELSAEALADVLERTGRTLPSRVWIPDQTRATGLFVYDICLDLRTLFCVSTAAGEPQLSQGMTQKLLDLGWTRTVNHFGPALLAPAKERERLIPALAKAILEWRIVTNQSRTFSLQETVAIAISTKADEVGNAIRAKLYGAEDERPRARPVLDEDAGAKLFIPYVAEGYISNLSGQKDALKNAEEELLRQLRAFDYGNQVKA
jgi:hypothetical protein